MDNVEAELQPVFSHLEPVLAVKDIPETLRYWQDVIGFSGQWTWGDPPKHAGMNWQKLFVQFHQDPLLADASKGNYIWIKVKRIKTLYAFHQSRKAHIVYPLQNQPWGMSEYTIKEINGYHLVFAGESLSEPSVAEHHLPPSVKFIARPLHPNEYIDLGISIKWWSDMSEQNAVQRLAAALYTVVAEDASSGLIIGCALLLGDGASFFYVKDVMVHPDWQRKRVGTSLMQHLIQWVEINAPEKSLIGLYTREGLESFYGQFGFAQSFGMIRYR